MNGTKIVCSRDIGKTFPETDPRHNLEPSGYDTALAVAESEQSRNDNRAVHKKELEGSLAELEVNELNVGPFQNMSDEIRTNLRLDNEMIYALRLREYDNAEEEYSSDEDEEGSYDDDEEYEM